MQVEEKKDEKKKYDGFGLFGEESMLVSKLEELSPKNK